MPLIWVTGISGSGKSSVATELCARGHRGVDADQDGLSVWVDRSTGAVVPSPEWGQRPSSWVTRHAWVLDAERVKALAANARDKHVFLCGSVENEKEVWDSFDQVICLVIDDDTVRRRLAARSNNDFGKSAEELQMVLGWNKAQAQYREFGATIVDATVPLDLVVDAVLVAAGLGPTPA